jgi:hypothetical protein
MLQPDVLCPAMSWPDFGKHRCSPAGYYTFYVAVTKNTCPISIVKEMFWTSTGAMKSYWCGTYWEDGYSILKDGKFLYCGYYTEVKPTGLKQWAECIVYEKDAKTEYCMFNFGAPFTVPN